MTQNTENPKKAPSHIVWFAPDRENAPWTRIGAMWPTRDGKGFRQVLDLVPTGKGNIVILPFEARATEPGAGAH